MGTGSGSGLASGGRFPNIVIYRYLPICPDEGVLSTITPDEEALSTVIYPPTQPKRCYLPPSPTPWRPSLSRLSPSKLILLKLPCGQSASAAQAATRAAWRRAQGVAGFKRASPTRPLGAAKAVQRSVGTFDTVEEAAAAVLAAEEQLKAGNDPWQQPARKNQHARGEVRRPVTAHRHSLIGPVRDLCVVCDAGAVSAAQDGAPARRDHQAQAGRQEG